MAKSDDQSKARQRRKRLAATVSAAKPAATAEDHSTGPMSACRTLEQVIAHERTQLLQAGSILACLYQVLLHADGDDAVTYAEAAYVAANIINESLVRLDSVHLRPLIEALGQGGAAVPGGGKSGFSVREPVPALDGWPAAQEMRPMYVC